MTFTLGNNGGTGGNYAGVIADNTGAGGTWNQMGASDPHTLFFPSTANVGGAPNSAVVMSTGTTLDLSTAGIGNAYLGSLADDPAGASGHQVLLGSNTLSTGLDGTSTTFSAAA